jgi:hypothetical protein
VMINYCFLFQNAEYKTKHCLTTHGSSIKFDKNTSLECVPEIACKTWKQNSVSAVACFKMSGFLCE